MDVLTIFTQFDLGNNVEIIASFLSNFNWGYSDQACLDVGPALSLTIASNPHKSNKNYHLLF